jgi:hypothetical protein
MFVSLGMERGEGETGETLDTAASSTVREFSKRPEDMNVKTRADRC